MQSIIKNAELDGKIGNRIFVSKTIDFPLISTKDKMISNVEDSK